MVKKVQNIVLWLENWFSQTKDVVLRNQGQANKNLVTDASGNVTLENKPVIDTVLADSTNAVQNSAINNAITTINGRLDDLESFKAIQIVDSLPTASADTMGTIYIISENGHINAYYTKQNGSAYEWEKLDDDILDEGIHWSAITDKPSTFPPTSHKHGLITNDGKLLTGSQLPQNNAIVITDASGNINGTASISTTKIQSANAYSNIGTEALATQNTINGAIDTKLGSFLDDIDELQTWVNDVNASVIPFAPSVSVWGDEGQMVREVATALNFLRDIIKSKQDSGDCVTSIELVPKSEDATGAIRLYYGDET